MSTCKKIVYIVYVYSTGKYDQRLHQSSKKLESQMRASTSAALLFHRCDIRIIGPICPRPLETLCEYVGKMVMGLSCGQSCDLQTIISQLCKISKKGMVLPFQNTFSAYKECFY